MNIIKLAGKKRKIRITIDYGTGEMDARVVGNSNGEGCPLGENERLLEDLLAAELPEYGDVVLEDQGLTDEGLLARQKNRTNPLPFNPLSPKPTNPVQIEEEQQGETRKLDTGFGI